jgi:hypothetical protein
MTPEKKKLWLYGGGAAALTFLVYFIFFNKPKKQSEPLPMPPPVKPDKPDVTDVYIQHLPTLVKTRSGTRLRKEPSTSSAIIKTYNSGINLYPSDSKDQPDGTWYYIDDEKGWVRSDVVDEVNI